MPYHQLASDPTFQAGRGFIGHRVPVVAARYSGQGYENPGVDRAFLQRVDEVYVIPGGGAQNGTHFAAVTTAGVCHLYEVGKQSYLFLTMDDNKLNFK
ncbi:hypothetical protein [Cupriavidus necator]